MPCTHAIKHVYPTCAALPDLWPNRKQYHHKYLWWFQLVVILTGGENHHKYLWWFRLVVITATSTCGDLDLWWKPPQVLVVKTTTKITTCTSLSAPQKRWPRKKGSSYSGRWLPGVGLCCFQMAQSGGGQTQGERMGRKPCSTGEHDPWPGFLPEVWPRVHEATMQQMHGPF